MPTSSASAYFVFVESVFNFSAVKHVAKTAVCDLGEKLRHRSRISSACASLVVSSRHSLMLETNRKVYPPAERYCLQQNVGFSRADHSCDTLLLHGPAARCERLASTSTRLGVDCSAT